jgi:hypothetical protein
MLRRVLIGILCVGVISLVVFGGRYLYQTWKYKKIVSENHQRNNSYT